jgi:hypothetical protein
MQSRSLRIDPTSEEQIPAALAHNPDRS